MTETMTYWDNTDGDLDSDWLGQWLTGTWHQRLASCLWLGQRRLWLGQWLTGTKMTVNRMLTGSNLTTTATGTVSVTRTTMTLDGMMTDWDITTTATGTVSVTGTTMTLNRTVIDWDLTTTATGTVSVTGTTMIWSPVPLFHLLYYLFYLSSPFFCDTEWPTRVVVSLNYNSQIGTYRHPRSHGLTELWLGLDDDWVWQGFVEGRYDLTVTATWLTKTTGTWMATGTWNNDDRDFDDGFTTTTWTRTSQRRWLGQRWRWLRQCLGLDNNGNWNRNWDLMVRDWQWRWHLELMWAWDLTKNEYDRVWWEGICDITIDCVLTTVTVTDRGHAQTTCTDDTYRRLMNGRMLGSIMGSFGGLDRQM